MHADPRRCRKAKCVASCVGRSLSSGACTIRCPLRFRAKYRLMPRAEALRAIHFPVDMAEQAQARRRLVYEEVLALEMHLMQQAQAETR